MPSLHPVWRVPFYGLLALLFCVNQWSLTQYATENEQLRRFLQQQHLQTQTSSSLSSNQQPQVPSIIKQATTWMQKNGLAWEDFSTASNENPNINRHNKMTEDELRRQALEILDLAVSNNQIHCEQAPQAANQIFYNRIGKAGSSTVIQLLRKNKAANVALNVDLVPSDRASDEFMTRQGELELIQKIVGSPKLGWMGQHRRILAYHTFYLNFTRYNLAPPIYVNLLREPAERYASQYEFWKTLPDIGKLTTDHGATLEVCLQGQYIGCPPLNYQTSYFCGHEDDCHDPPTDASFLQAVRHVVQEYAVVGTLERLDEFKRQMALHLPQFFAKNKLAQWQKPSNERVNANKRNKHERPQDELARIRAANLYDALLYEVVDKIVDQRALACNKRTATTQ